MSDGTFFRTTADDERDAFVGELSPVRDCPIPATLPDGQYRVICGELYRVLPGVPPALLSTPDVGEPTMADASKLVTRLSAEDKDRVLRWLLTDKQERQLRADLAVPPREPTKEAP